MNEIFLIQTLIGLIVVLIVILLYPFSDEWRGKLLKRQPNRNIHPANDSEAMTDNGKQITGSSKPPHALELPEIEQETP